MSIAYPGQHHEATLRLQLRTKAAGVRVRPLASGVAVILDDAGTALIVDDEELSAELAHAFEQATGLLAAAGGLS